MSNASMKNAKLYTPAIQKKLSQIKCILLDCDGVLTDGKVFWVKDSGWTRVFSVKDGYGIRMALKNGFEVGILTGASSQDVLERASLLGVKHVYSGSEDKILGFNAVLRETGFKAKEILYIGDEYFDIPVLKEVGFSATVPHAQDSVKKACHVVTKNQGGDGAVREVIEALFKAHKIKEPHAK